MVDARYAGQNHELTVDVPAGPFTAQALAATKANFHRGASRNVRLRLAGKTDRARDLPLARPPPGRAWQFRGSASRARARARSSPPCTRQVYFDDPAGFVACPVYDRDTLMPGDAFRGPAIVEQMDCTTVVPPDFGVRVDDAGNLIS